MNNQLLPNDFIEDEEDYDDEDSDEYDVDDEVDENTEVYSACFDVEKGEFCVSAGGKIELSDSEETWKCWCDKILSAQNGAYRGYPEEYCIDYESAFQCKNRYEAENMLESEITNALMSDERVSYVTATFEWLQDYCIINVQISGMYGEYETEIEYETG